MARLKMKNTVRLQKPLLQEISLESRYDREWKCHFLSIENFESSPGDDRRTGEEITICINNKEERDRLLEMITKATAHIK